MTMTRRGVFGFGRLAYLLGLSKVQRLLAYEHLQAVGMLNDGSISTVLLSNGYRLDKTLKVGTDNTSVLKFEVKVYAVKSGSVSIQALLTSCGLEPVFKTQFSGSLNGNALLTHLADVAASYYVFVNDVLFQDSGVASKMVTPGQVVKVVALTSNVPAMPKLMPK